MTSRDPFQPELPGDPAVPGSGYAADRLLCAVGQCRDQGKQEPLHSERQAKGQCSFTTDAFMKWDVTDVALHSNTDRLHFALNCGLTGRCSGVGFAICSPAPLLQLVGISRRGGRRAALPVSLLFIPIRPSQALSPLRSLSLMSVLFFPQVPFSGRRMHHTCPCLPGLACVRTSPSKFKCLPDFRKEDVFF